MLQILTYEDWRDWQLYYGDDTDQPTPTDPDQMTDAQKLAVIERLNKRNEELAAKRRAAGITNEPPIIVQIHN